MSTKSPECWASDPQAHGLRIEISAEHTLLPPFDQFVFAELKNEGKEQRLRLVFATHEILAHGHALRRIETAIQRRELSHVARITEDHHGLVAEGQPVVKEIIVVEVNGTDDNVTMRHADELFGRTIPKHHNSFVAFMPSESVITTEAGRNSRTIPCQCHFAFLGCRAAQAK